MLNSTITPDLLKSSKISPKIIHSINWFQAQKILPRSELIPWRFEDFPLERVVESYIGEPLFSEDLKLIIKLVPKLRWLITTQEVNIDAMNLVLPSRARYALQQANEGMLKEFSQESDELAQMYTTFETINIHAVLENAENIALKAKQLARKKNQTSLVNALI